MKKVTRIVIKGSSGYCSINNAYNDKVTISDNSISYEYKPLYESENNSLRKWNYKTNSIAFLNTYKKIVGLIEEILNTEDEVFCTDVGEITFVITFSDKSKQTRTFFCSGEYFKECFTIIKLLVPKCEYVPAVLLTEEDYK